MEILKRKKGDMNFWLVTLVIALIFMVIVFFVMNSVFQKWGETTGGVQEEVKKQGDVKDIFEGITDSDKESTSESTTSSDTKE
ncbi:hypothetical protein HZC31_02200 [Candidatus Woesearchaeota archaeon]|nr:hypothetical protein [Candidatus Woesearchaeota archaeon]